MELRITEIFYSLQGEGILTGWPTVFIRLTGCPLRCTYCDTAYAFSGGKLWKFSEILAEVSQYQTRFITVTGGEPLAQPNAHSLLTQLCNEGYQVSLETSGALSVENVDSRVMKVLDLKTPASGESQRNLYTNLDYLSANDQVKFVIANNSDYEWAKNIMRTYSLAEKCTVLFSPVHQVLDNLALSEWLLADNLPARFQLQLHKYIWGDARGK